MVYTPRTKSRRQMLEKRGTWFRKNRHKHQEEEEEEDVEEERPRVMNIASSTSFDSDDIEVGQGPALMLSEEADETGSFLSGMETQSEQKEQPDAATGTTAAVVTATPSNNTVSDMRQKAKLAHLRHKKYLKEQKLAKLQDSILTREGDAIDYVFDHVESFVCKEGTSDIPVGNTINKGKEFLAKANMPRTPSYADGDTNSMIAESLSGSAHVDVTKKASATNRAMTNLWTTEAEEKMSEPSEPFRIPNSNLLVVVANAEDGEIKQQQWNAKQSQNNEDYISPTSLSSTSATSPFHQLLDGDEEADAEERKFDGADMILAQLNNNYNANIRQLKLVQKQQREPKRLEKNDVLDKVFTKVETLVCRDKPNQENRQLGQPDIIEKTCSSFESAMECSPSKEKVPLNRLGWPVHDADGATTMTGSMSLGQNSLLEPPSDVVIGSDKDAQDVKSEPSTSPLKLHKLATQIEDPDDDYIFETVETFVCREEANGLRGAVKIRTVQPPLHSQTSPPRQSAATPTAASPETRARVTIRRDNSLLDAELSTNSTEDTDDVDEHDLELGGQSKLDKIRQKKRWIEKQVCCTTNKGPDGTSQILVPRGYKSPSPRIGLLKTPRSSGGKRNPDVAKLPTSGGGARQYPGDMSDDEVGDTIVIHDAADTEAAVIKGEEDTFLCSFKKLEQLVMVLVCLLVVGALGIVGLSFFWPKAKQGV